MRFVSGLVLILACCLAGSAVSAQSPGQSSASAQLRLKRFILDDCFVRFTSTSEPDWPPAPNGAVRANVTKPLVLEHQVGGFQWIRRGVFEGRPEWVSTGWRILDWGLAQQQADGRFPTVDGIHQTTRFLEAVASSMVIDPAGATAARKERLYKGLQWLDSPVVKGQASRSGANFTHRLWMRAALFSTSALVLGRPELEAVADAAVRQAMQQQFPNGAYPERGGEDVGYHPFGMLYEVRWFAAAGPSNPEYSAALRSLERGYDWYRSKISPESGMVDRRGSTRMGREGLSHKNGPKDVNYGRAVEVMLGAALITGDARKVEFARALSAGGSAERKLPRDFPQRFGRTGLDAAVATACTRF